MPHILATVDEGHLGPGAAYHIIKYRFVMCNEPALRGTGVFVQGSTPAALLTYRSHPVKYEAFEQDRRTQVGVPVARVFLADHFNYSGEIKW